MENHEILAPLDEKERKNIKQTVNHLFDNSDFCLFIRYLNEQFCPLSFNKEHDAFDAGKREVTKFILKLFLERNTPPKPIKKKIDPLV